MEEKGREFIKYKILQRFLDLNDSFKFGEYKEIFPNKNIIYFELNESKYIFFFTDYIGDNIDYVSDELEEIGVKVKKYIPLKENPDIYIFSASSKKAPYIYEPVFDDRFVCGRVE